MAITLSGTSITFNDATTQSTNGVEFAAGTAMLFAQTSAPTGWTKAATHDNKALRVVTGTASSGGTVAFTTAFASKAVTGTTDATTLTTTQIPSHTHNMYFTNGFDNTGAVYPTGGIGIRINNLYYASNTSGGGGSHTHTFTGTAIDLAVQYVDVIIATKN